MFTTKITISDKEPTGAYMKLNMLLASWQYRLTDDEHIVFVELPVSMYECRHHGLHINHGDIYVAKKHHVEICEAAIGFLNHKHSSCYSFSNIGPTIDLVLDDADVHCIAVQRLLELENQQHEVILAAQLKLEEAKRTGMHYNETILAHERIITKYRKESTTNDRES
jgi:hypothetical protein